MIHIEDLKRIDFTKMDGLEQTAPVRMASKVIEFPERVQTCLLKPRVYEFTTKDVVGVAALAVLSALVVIGVFSL